MANPFNDVAKPLDNPDNRFHGQTIDEVNDKLDDEGRAVGMDVWQQVKKGYVNYLRGDIDLADAQLASLLDALQRTATAP